MALRLNYRVPTFRWCMGELQIPHDERLDWYNVIRVESSLELQLRRHGCSIRSTTDKDYAAVRQLLTETGLVDPYFDQDRFEGMLDRNSSFCYVAEISGNVVGNAFGAHDGGFRGYISKVAVGENWRRRGIASGLVKRILEAMDEAKIPLVFSHVEKTNAASLAMLQRSGFQIRDTHYLADRTRKEA